MVPTSRTNTFFHAPDVGNALGVAAACVVVSQAMSAERRVHGGCPCRLTGDYASRLEHVSLAWSPSTRIPRRSCPARTRWSETRGLEARGSGPGSRTIRFQLGNLSIRHRQTPTIGRTQPHPQPCNRCRAKRRTRIEKGLQRQRYTVVDSCECLTELEFGGMFLEAELVAVPSALAPI